MVSPLHPENSVQELEELQQQIRVLQHALAVAEERHRREMEAVAAASEARESKVSRLCMICSFWNFTECTVLKPARDCEQEAPTSFSSNPGIPVHLHAPTASAPGICGSTALPAVASALSLSLNCNSEQE